jgi:hypothetical protein
MTCIDTLPVSATRPPSRLPPEMPSGGRAGSHVRAAGVADLASNGENGRRLSRRALL